MFWLLIHPIRELLYTEKEEEVAEAMAAEMEMKRRGRRRWRKLRRVWYRTRATRWRRLGRIMRRRRRWSKG